MFYGASSRTLKSQEVFVVIQLFTTRIFLATLLIIICSVYFIWNSIYVVDDFDFEKWFFFLLQVFELTYSRSIFWREITHHWILGVIHWGNCGPIESLWHSVCFSQLYHSSYSHKRGANFVVTLHKSRAFIELPFFKTFWPTSGCQPSQKVEYHFH